MTQEKDLPEDDLKEVRNLLTRFWFKKAEQEAEKSMKAKGMTQQHSLAKNFPLGSIKTCIVKF